MEQSYFARGKDYSARIRSQKDNLGKVKKFFTFKHDIEGEVVEIQKKIDDVDYFMLSKIATNFVKKIRYEIGMWEVDFFKDTEGETYFAMAEIELPRSVKEPSVTPDFITENLLYKVERHDFRFSSKKLSNIEYAKKILEDLRKAGKISNIFPA